MRVMLILLLFAVATIAAPVPMVKKQHHITQENMVGSWKFIWGNLSGTVNFTNDGRAYATYTDGDVTIGTWNLCRKDVLQWVEDKQEYELDMSLIKGEISGPGYYISNNERIISCEKYLLVR